MGNPWSRPAPAIQNVEQGQVVNGQVEAGVESVRAQKRTRSDNEEEAEIDTLLHTPKKKRLKTTSRYIYETLFIEGRDSDMVVSSLNRDWKLHKLYLCQSPYFSSMFNGNWRESNMDHIDITIVDPNISLDSMNVTLGSLYQDEISVEPADVIPILATATLFQLDGLIDQCSSIMDETINIETVVKYHEAGLLYGSARIQQACIQWLKVNLLSHLPEHPAKLRQIPMELMQKLVNDSGLFVMQTEFSVYVLLRLWIYLIFHPAWDGSPQDAVMSSHKFFQVNYLSNAQEIEINFLVVNFS